MTENLSEQRQPGDVAQKFRGLVEANKIPPGVNPLQVDLIIEADEAGALERLHTLTALMIEEYFSSEKSYQEMAEEYGITHVAITKRISRGMGKIRKVLYKERPELSEENKYPLEEVKRGKNRLDVCKSEKSKEKRRRSAHNRRTQTTLI